MTQTVEPGEMDAGRAGVLRLLIGGVQGAVLYLLTRAFADHGWNVWVSGAFCAVLLSPAVALAEISRMAPRRLALWFAIAFVVVGLLGVWGAWREAGPLPYQTGILVSSGFAIPGCAILLFVAHHLVVAGTQTDRWIAPYTAYFDAAWRHALQVELSGLFLSIFWAILYLGAFLFELIGQNFLTQLIRHDWFWIPVSAVVFAGAVHLTDVRIGLIRGFRTVVLALFAVLLPLVAGLSALFLLLGAGTIVKGAWTVQNAAATLLAMSMAMILFINAAYQDGAEERLPGVMLRWTMRIAPFLIVALALLSAKTVLALVLRHGWTPDRVIAGTAALIVLAHGAGYAWAALGKGAFMKRLEPTNILAGHVTLAIGLLLLSPVGDPARLSVDDQLARLADGKVRPERFDFSFLAQRSARFGREALVKLSKSPDVRTADLAQAAQAGISAVRFVAGGRPIATPGPVRQVTQADVAALIQLYPAGTVLPPRFLPTIQDQSRNFAVPTCLQGIGQCVGYLIDLDHDGKPELLLWQGDMGVAFKEQPGGQWRLTGRLDPFCRGVGDAIRAGLVSTKPALDEIDVGGARLRVTREPTGPCMTTAEAQRQGVDGKGPKTH